MFRKILQSLLITTIITTSFTNIVSFTSNQIVKKDNRTDLKTYFKSAQKNFNDEVVLFPIDYRMLKNVTESNFKEIIGGTFEKLMFYHYPDLRGINMNLVSYNQKWLTIQLNANTGKNSKFKGIIKVTFNCQLAVKEELYQPFIKHPEILSYWQVLNWSNEEKIFYCHMLVKQFAEENGLDYYFQRDLTTTTISLNNKLLQIKNNSSLDLSWQKDLQIDFYQGSITQVFENFKDSFSSYNEEELIQEISRIARIDRNEFIIQNFNINKENNLVSFKITPNSKLRKSLQKFQLNSFKEFVNWPVLKITSA